MRLGTLVTVANPREAIRNSAAALEAGIPLIVDSGAWSNFTGSANVTVKDHISYLKDNWIKDARHISLDVIKDADGSFRNWATERDAGLAVEPTIHYGVDPSYVDRYVRIGLATEWVNLGGMAHLQRRKGLHRKMASWCAAVIARAPTETRFHGLGAATPGLNDLIKLDACDSTYWMQAARFGVFPVFDSATARFVQVPRNVKNHAWMNGKYQRLGKLGDILTANLQVSATEVLAMTVDQLNHLSMISHCQFAEHYERRHGHTMTVYLAASGLRHYPEIQQLNAEWSKA